MDNNESLEGWWDRIAKWGGGGSTVQLSVFQFTAFSLSQTIYNHGGWRRPKAIQPLELQPPRVFGRQQRE